MDRLKKFIRRLDEKTSDRVEACFVAIRANAYQHLDIQPLKGIPNAFRCRLGMIRIIFIKCQEENVIVDVGFRKDVYKRLQR